MENDGEKANMKFEETELRLGLPGGGGGGGGGVEGDHGVKNSNNGKRGFEEIVDLKLNLSMSKVLSQKVIKIIPSNDPPPNPPAKSQVVGWPPVRSFRKNILAVQKHGDEEREKLNSSNVGVGGAAFVKVSLDGAPYLRKVDLKMYKTYKELSDALGNLFISFTIGNCGMKDFMNESKLMDLLSGSDFVPTYEDKDGDWMLVGDVPWEMFVNSCKRLRIMKGTDAKGLAPRAMQKCKNRN